MTHYTTLAMPEEPEEGDTWLRAESATFPGTCKCDQRKAKRRFHQDLFDANLISPETKVRLDVADEEQQTFRESPKTLLQEADAIINGERQKEYGPPAESFDRIARLWSDYLDQTVTSLDVVNLMILLKVSRAKTGGFHRDSYVDCAGYAGAAELIVKEQEK